MADKKLYAIMQKEMLCSEHAAACFVEARRRERQNNRVLIPRQAGKVTAAKIIDRYKTKKE